MTPGPPPGTGSSLAVDAVFVYGTLQPGQPRWPVLAPLAAGKAAADRVRGVLLDTGAGYPGLVRIGAGGWVPGAVVPLRPPAAAALRALDEMEATAAQLFRRVQATTEHGVTCWTYEYLRADPGMRPVSAWPA